MENRIVLMNSAMMPAPGTYVFEKIDKSEFISTIKDAVSNKTEIQSSIGYPNVVNLIHEMTGLQVSCNRALTVLNDGDKVLVMKLGYRIEPDKKGVDTPEVDQYEYFKSTYHLARQCPTNTPDLTEGDQR